MRKKDKKIEIQIAEKQVSVSGQVLDGYVLTAGKKEIGQIVELDDQFAIVENGHVSVFYKKLDQAVEKIIENFNLNH